MKPTTEHNPDTQPLATELHRAWLDALDEGLSLNETWYRVAIRAKQLKGMKTRHCPEF
jgi:hypothetical protein